MLNFEGMKKKGLVGSIIFFLAIQFYTVNVLIDYRNISYRKFKKTLTRSNKF